MFDLICTPYRAACLFHGGVHQLGSYLLGHCVIPYRVFSKVETELNVFFFSLSLLLNNTVGWVKGKQYFRLLLSSVFFFFFSLSFSKGETFCRDCFTVNRGDCPRESCRSFLSDEKGSITLNALTGPTSTVHQSPLNSTCSTVAFQVLGALMRGDTFVAMFCT